MQIWGLYSLSKTVIRGAAAATVTARLIEAFIINPNEIVKLSVVYRHYQKYKWVKDLTEKENAK